MSLTPVRCHPPTGQAEGADIGLFTEPSRLNGGGLLKGSYDEKTSEPDIQVSTQKS